MKLILGFFALEADLLFSVSDIKKISKIEKSQYFMLGLSREVYFIILNIG